MQQSKYCLGYGPSQFLVRRKVFDVNVSCVQIIEQPARKGYFIFGLAGTEGRFLTLGAPAAAALLERVKFHYTPKHANWLKMAEITIGIMDRQRTRRRIETAVQFEAEAGDWQRLRNAAGRGIEWRFTRQDADRALCRHSAS